MQHIKQIRHLYTVLCPLRARYEEVLSHRLLFTPCFPLPPLTSLILLMGVPFLIFQNSIYCILLTLLFKRLLNLLLPSHLPGASQT